jgi:hypothetical protein
MDDKKQLRTLVRGIVLAQGNLFIKELLRAKKIHLGTGKADFEANLLAAIERGHLQLQDVEEWLEHVEGWGDQHVYLYSLPPKLAEDKGWRNAAHARQRVRAAGLGALWNATTTHLFPNEPTLTSIRCDGDVLRLLWHQGADSLVRSPGMDREQSIKGDDYVFRAYRRRADRTVMRFELHFPAANAAYTTGCAALFIPAPIRTSAHVASIAAAASALEKLIDFQALDQCRVSVANIIKNFDQAQVAASGSNGAATVRPASTRFAAAGAFVEFGSTGRGQSFLESEPVRAVRKSIRTPQLGHFSGERGLFEFLEDHGLSQDAKVELHGNERRIRIWKQLSAQDVWRVLRTLLDHQ